MEVLQQSCIAPREASRSRHAASYSIRVIDYIFCTGTAAVDGHTLLADAMVATAVVLAAAASSRNQNNTD